MAKNKKQKLNNKKPLSFSFVPLHPIHRPNGFLEYRQKRISNSIKGGEVVVAFH